MLVMAVVAGVPLAVLAVAGLRIQTKALRVDESLIQIETIDQCTQAIRRILDDAEEGTHRTGRLLTEPSIIDDDARMNLARETVGRMGALREVFIYRSDGTLLDGIERAPAKWELAMARPPPVLASPMPEAGGWLPLSFAGNEPLLRYAEPCDRDGQRRAWVAGVVTPGLLSRRLQEIASSVFGVYLIDETGRVLAAADAAKVGSVLDRPGLRGTTFSAQWGWNNEYDVQGEPLVGSIRTIPEYRWALLVERPRAEAYFALTWAHHLVILLALSGLVLAIAVSGWQARRRTQPVSALVDLTRQYAARHFEARSTVHTGDELEQLGRAMMEMADAIATGEREIARHEEFEAQLAPFKTTLDRTQDAVFFFRPDDLKVFYVNKGAVEQLGYSEAELLQLTPMEFKPRFDEVRLRELLEPLRRGEKEVLKLETIHRRKDGSEIPVEVVVQYLAIEGEPPRFIEVVRDMTERHQIDRMKAEFVSVVSHELRTPLTSIRGSLKLIEAEVKGKIPKEVMPLIKIASSNTERLIRLINDILDVEKMEAGKLELRLEPLDLGKVIGNALDGIQGMATQAEVQAASDVAPGIQLRADRDRLTQVIVNLVSNAVKFSPRGGRVDVSAVPAGNRVRVNVSDRGPGIPEAQRHKLFGKFQQLDSTDSRKKGGTGLGLAISKAIVLQHGGAIGVEAREGGGSTFWFELPTG
jgi:PAS domain S-box-containing protein